METDIDEEYTDASGFALTKAVEESYMTTLANDIHSLGLGWWIKNPDDTGDSYATDMFPLADAVLTEQCNQFSTCGSLSAYIGHKAVFNAEYRSLRLRSVPKTSPGIQRSQVQSGPHRRQEALPVAATKLVREVWC